MPQLWNDEFDLNSPGSRFTTRIAVAIPVSEEEWPETVDDDGREAKRVLETSLASLISRYKDLIGEPAYVNGSFGRGASSWIPVVEWSVQVAIAGIIGGAAWAATAQIAQLCREMLQALRGRYATSVLVSRGMAVYLAIGHVLTDCDVPHDTVLHVEAAEEPSFIRGETAHELNYVLAEPWFVFLYDSDYNHRYIVVVSPHGEINGSLCIMMGRGERWYLGGKLD